jgi:cytochrome P450
MDTEVGNGVVSSANGAGRSFDPLGAHLQDPYPFYAMARADEPVFYSTTLQAWCVARYADVIAVLRDFDTFASTEIIPRPRNLPPDFDDLFDWFYGPAALLSFADPPAHTRMRTVVNAGLTPKAIRPFEPAIRRIVGGLIDQLHDRAEFEVLEDFARPLVMSVVLGLAGIPAQRHRSLVQWNQHLFAIFVGSHALELETLRASKRIVDEGLDYIRSLVRQRAAHPQNDLVSFFLHGRTRGHRLGPEEVVGQVLTLLAAGFESVSNAVANSVRILIDRREQWNRLGERDSLTDRIISECLRLNGSVATVYRTTRRATAIGGVDIPEGDPVCLLWGSANRDEAVFHRAGEFVPERAEDTKNLTYGFGIHYCVGVPLAKLTMRIALSALRRRCPDLHLAPGDQPRYRQISTFRALESLHVGR